MAFSPEFLDELRNRVPPSEVVGKRVKLVKKGREFSGLCPFHNEKTPSFTVNDDKGFYHCFGCGAHGSAIDFVMNTEGLSFPETVERLAGLAGLEVPQERPEDRARAEKRAGLVDVTEAAAAWFEEQLQSAAGKEARDYLERRGLAPQTVKAFRLGFAPRSRGLLAKALRARGITVDQLLEAGLVKQGDDGPEDLRDYFFHRIIFPITDRRGRVIAFGGRTLGESKAKYLNSPDTPLFHKGRVLYNLARARKAAHDTGELLVTEGYMDVIALAEGGFPAAVAPLGTAITEEQIEELWRLTPEPTLCFDGDTAGQRAAFRAAARALPLLKPGKSLLFALLPPGEDPDSLLRGQGAAALRSLLETAQPLADMVWRQATEGRPADTPERRAAIRAELRDQCRTIRAPELREDYRQEMERRFELVFGYGPKGGGAPGGRMQAGSRQGGGFRGQRGAWGKRGGSWGGTWGPPEAPAKRRRQGDLPRPERTEQLLLATLINHNKLLIEFVEDLVGIDFVSAELNQLRQALIDCMARNADLDTEGVKCHLSNQGYSGLLDRLLAPDVYVHGRFARPDSSAEVARQFVLHILGVLRDRQSGVQRDEEAQALAADMTAEQLKRVQARQKLRLEDEGRKVDLDRFEAMLQTTVDKADS